LKRSDNKRFSQITRRGLLLGTAGFTISTILAARLYYLQFLQGDRYRTQAEENRIKLHLTPPLRGVITDRRATPLATNEQNYRMLLRTDQVSDLQETIQAIGKLTPLSEDVKQEVLTKRKPGRYAPPVLLKEFLTWDEVASIEFHSASIPGLVIEVGQVRYYPYADAMSHVIGYVGTVSEDDLDDRDLLKLPNFKVGKDGVEKKLEMELRGKPGVKEVEVNVHGLAVRELNTQLSTPGKEIHLTIDARLQNTIFDQLKGESAGCVVMDIERGDILAMMSCPSFDPNRFSKGITTKYWNQLRENERVPLMNKATAGQYPPGSTFKMLVGMAGLEDGAVSQSERIYCPGHFFLGKHRFNCWKPGGHGHVDYRTAVAQSCDVYFYTVAQRIGIEKIADMAHRMGLGESFGLPIGAERTGLIPTPDWKRRSYGQVWHPGDSINAAIGQGYVLATPLQLAVMTARLASGRQVVPRLVIPDEETPETPLPSWPLLDIKPEYIKAAQEGMYMVTNTTGGTAYGSRIREPEFAMSGKTGTSQVRRITVRGQDQNTIPWKYRHHALFVAYAPSNAPRYACGLIIEHGGGGGVAAGHVKNILLTAQKLHSTIRSDFLSHAPDIVDGASFIGPMPFDASTPARARLPWLEDTSSQPLSEDPQ
jgi:penicillin-binding protein 2